MHIRNSLPDEVVVQRIDERLSALGNCIACNDYVALIHPDIDRVGGACGAGKAGRQRRREALQRCICAPTKAVTQPPCSLWSAACGAKVAAAHCLRIWQACSLAQFVTRPGVGVCCACAAGRTHRFYSLTTAAAGPAGRRRRRR